MAKSKALDLNDRVAATLRRNAEIRAAKVDPVPLPTKIPAKSPDKARG